LEACDAIAVPVDGFVERMRILNVTDSLPNLRALEMTRDDDGTYISYAVGSSTNQPPSSIPFFGPVDMVFMDLPPLSTTDDDAGFYAASRPLMRDGAFRGAIFLRSTDGGGNYATVGSVDLPAPMGRLIEGIPPGPTTIFDESSEILVEMDYGELESRTEMDVLGGANSAAVGADGRWMIVQFKDAENVAGRIWRLTGLLQGRRATENFVGTTLLGDRFVMISTGAVARISMAVVDIARPLPYKAVPIGQSAEGIDPSNFRGRGVALKPFSPTHIEGERDDDGVLTITWVRRDRLATDVVIPMSEEVLDFEVDILDGGDVVRTISVSEESAIYSDAQQITDFGSVQSAITVRIYQISVTVGRGTAAEATL
jgi:hypothetical protein